VIGIIIEKEIKSRKPIKRTKIKKSENKKKWQ